MSEKVRPYQTATKLALQIDNLLAKIDAHESDDVDALSIEDLHDFELESTELEIYMVGNKTKVLLQDMDLIRFRQELEADQALLNNIAQTAK